MAGGGEGAAATPAFSRRVFTRLARQGSSPYRRLTLQRGRTWRGSAPPGSHPPAPLDVWPLLLTRASKWEDCCLQGEDGQGRMAPTFCPWTPMLHTQEPWAPRSPQKKGHPHSPGGQVRPGQRQRLGWPRSVPVALGDGETGGAAGVSTGRAPSGPAPGWDLPGQPFPASTA